MPDGPNGAIQRQNSGAFLGTSALSTTEGGGTIDVNIGENGTLASILLTDVSGNGPTITAAIGGTRWPLTLPPDAGTPGDYLRTDAGVLTWEDPDTRFDPLGAAAAAQAASDPLGSAATAQAAAEAASDPVGSAAAAVNAALPAQPVATPICGTNTQGTTGIWTTSSPVLALYSPATPGDWAGSPPANLQAAIDRLAAWATTAAATINTLVGLVPGSGGGIPPGP